MRSDRFRAAAEGKDFSRLDEIFAEDVSFRSPVVFEHYDGLEPVAMLLGMVAHVFEDFRYTDQIETGDTAALAFEARVGDRELEGIDLLRFDSEGKVREMVVYIRPMSGVKALAEAMQRKLDELAKAPA